MSTTSLKFRNATRDDVEVLLLLIHSAFRGEESRAGWTTEADFASGDRIDAPGLIEKIEAPDSVVLVVTDCEGVLLSCCEIVWRPDQETCYFGLFAVDPKRQGGGVGRQVLAYVEDYARRQWGARRLEMVVIWARVDIIAWYERKGFKRTGEKRPFPHEMLALIGGKALRDDLYFEVLVKELILSDEALEVK
jgi:GNAT superfamily N-acetyltransferase